MDSVEAVEKILNYSFTNKNLLKEVITLTSCNSTESYLLFKRLEYLGDSVLAVVLSNHIHLYNPNLTLRELCELRYLNVSNEKFARVAVKHNLYQYLILDDPDPSLHEQIKEFSEAVHKEDNPVPYGGFVIAPKFLADLVESIAGAVYIDMNFDLQRFWEIFRGLVEPIYTLDDLRHQHEQTFDRLFRLGDKHGKRIDFRYSKDETDKNIVEVYVGNEFIASKRAYSRTAAKRVAANEALHKLSESTHIGNIVHEDSLHVELDDVKRKLFEICPTEKLRLQSELSSLPTASENSLTDETTQEQMVIDEDSPHVEPDNAKGKFFESCSSRKLQIQIRLSSLPVNPLTYEMTINHMVADEVEPIHARGKLLEICNKNKWSMPIFSVEEERGPKNEKSFVYSVKVEIPTVEATFHIKGDAKSTRKKAGSSSAYDMILALTSPLMSLVISKLQMQEILNVKKNLYLFSSEINSDSVEGVEKILKYSFSNKNLLKEALTENSSSQRLMFIGKPAISLAFTNHLYLTCPKLDPKKLDLVRNANTRDNSFARVAVKHGLYPYFIRYTSKADREILKYIELMGKEDDPDPYRCMKGPKALAELVDYVSGAVFIDVNLDVRRLWEILRSLFEPIYMLDDLGRQPHPLLTLLFLAYKNNKRLEVKYRERAGRSFIAEVYLDDEFIARGKDSKCRDSAKMNAATVALQKLSETMPIEMIMNDNIEYEDAKEKLIEICNKRKLPNPVFSVENESSVKGFSVTGFAYSVKIETQSEEGTLYVKGDRKKQRKAAENNSASHMIRILEASPLSLVISNLKKQHMLEEKKNRKMQKSLEKEKNQLSKKRKHESVEEEMNPKKRKKMKSANVETEQESANGETEQESANVEEKKKNPKKRKKMKSANVETEQESANGETEQDSANVEREQEYANVETEQESANVETEQESATEEEKKKKKNQLSKKRKHESVEEKKKKKNLKKRKKMKSANLETEQESANGETEQESANVEIEQESASKGDKR